MEEIVKHEDFIFKKSQLKDGIVKVKYAINFKTIEGVRHPRIDDDIKDPHPDLKKSIASFKEMLLEMWGFDEENNNVNVTGLQVKYKGDETCVTILGEREIEGDWTDMNSPEIHLSENQTYGKKLRFLYENHKKEVYEALYRFKTSQQRLDLKETD